MTRGSNMTVGEQIGASINKRVRDDEELLIKVVTRSEIYRVCLGVESMVGLQNYALFTGGKNPENGVTLHKWRMNDFGTVIEMRLLPLDSEWIIVAGYASALDGEVVRYSDWDVECKGITYSGIRQEDHDRLCAHLRMEK